MTSILVQSSSCRFIDIVYRHTEPYQVSVPFQTQSKNIWPYHLALYWLCFWLIVQYVIYHDKFPVLTCPLNVSAWLYNPLVNWSVIKHWPSAWSPSFISLSVPKAETLPNSIIYLFFDLGSSCLAHPSPEISLAISPEPLSLLRVCSE